jgi:hypothetical protein
LFCRFDRRHRYKEKDWRVTHHSFIENWENRHAQGDNILHEGRQPSDPHDQDAFNEYLRWLHRSTRVFLLQPLDAPVLDDEDHEDVAEDEFDDLTRDDTQPQRAPLQRSMVR